MRVTLRISFTTPFSSKMAMPCRSTSRFSVFDIDLCGSQSLVHTRERDSRTFTLRESQGSASRASPFLDLTNGARLTCSATPRFAVFGKVPPSLAASGMWSCDPCQPQTSVGSSQGSSGDGSPTPGVVLLELDCAYTAAHIKAAFGRRGAHRWEVRELGAAASFSSTGDDESQREAAAGGKQEGRGGEEEEEEEEEEVDPTMGLKGRVVVQWREYAAMSWAAVMSGRTIGSSFSVRKGISRKAQLWLSCRRHFTKLLGSGTGGNGGGGGGKSPKTSFFFCGDDGEALVRRKRGLLLKRALPETLVVETWEAFEEDVRIDFGDGDVACFGSGQSGSGAGFGKGGAGGFGGGLSVGQRLLLCLGEAQEAMAEAQAQAALAAAATRGEGGGSGGGNGGNGGGNGSGLVRWIVKPSYANKGAEIGVVESFEELQCHLLEHHELREWVVQRYVPRPLLFRGRKFHLRVYVLCVGALQVYVYDEVLLLCAQAVYDPSDLSDRTAFLTNTAVQAQAGQGQVEDEYDEGLCVHLLSDLASELQRPSQGGVAGGYGFGPEGARVAQERVLEQIKAVTGELFAAYRSEGAASQGGSASFQPLPTAFEHFGLDYMLDEGMRLWLLEVNPGPDFRQTGQRLGGVVGRMIDASVTVAIERDLASVTAANTANNAHAAATNASACKTALPDLTTPLESAQARCAGTLFTAVYAENWQS